MDSLLTLTYVNIRGLAEPINLMLVDAKISYRNERMILSQWKTREAEGTYGPVYGQPFHDLPTLSVKTTLGTVTLAGIFTILEYLEDAFDTHAGQDILYKDSETWDSSEERHRFRQERITPFLLDLSRHIGVNGLQGDFGADTRRPLTAAGACAFEALDLIETFYPAILNDWPVLAILRGRVSIRPNIQSYLNGGKREPKVSMSRHETPERVAYLSLKDFRSSQPRKSESGAAPSIYSTNTSESVSMGMGSSPKMQTHVLRKRHHPSISSISKGTSRSRPSEEDTSHTTTPPKKDDSSSRKRSEDHSEEKRPRSRSFTDLFLRKKNSRGSLQPSSNPTSTRVMDPDGDNRSIRSVQRGHNTMDSSYRTRDSAPSIEHTIPGPTFSMIIPKSTLKFPIENDNMRSSVHSGSIYSTSSGPEYSVIAQAI